MQIACVKICRKLRDSHPFMLKLVLISKGLRLGTSRALKEAARRDISSKEAASEPKMKTPILPQAIRDAVIEALNIQRAKGKPRRWDQAIHCVAIGCAVNEYVSDPANLPDGSIEPIKFAQTYGAHGFLANCSQFAQVLDALDVSDDCYIKRETRGSRLDEYK